MPPHPLHPTVSVRRLHHLSETQQAALADLLVACVSQGASVSFLHPLTRPRALAFWHQVAEATAKSERAVLVAEQNEHIVGTVQLLLAQPENQPHRADLAKLLVSPAHRRLGIGRSLMCAAQTLACDCSKTLLVLDTASAAAAQLYTKLGWQRVGLIPNYAYSAYGEPEATTYFYLQLEATARPPVNSPA